MFRTIKELPGVPCGSEVEYFLKTELNVYVLMGKPSMEYPLAYIPKSDLHLWIVDDNKPKEIEKLDCGLQTGSNWEYDHLPLRLPYQRPENGIRT